MTDTASAGDVPGGTRPVKGAARRRLDQALGAPEIYEAG